MSAAEIEVASAAADPSAEREERFRLAVLAASGPLLLLGAPLVLPLEERGPFYRLASREPEAFAIFTFILFWPIFVGAFGLVRALRQRAPGTAAFAVPALVHMLAGVATVFLLAYAMADHRRARESPGVWLALVCALGIVILLGRGFRRSGWERWAQMVAGVWLTYFAAVLVVATETRDLFEQPESGAWVLMFGLSAAAPAVGWILSLFRRRS